MTDTSKNKSPRTTLTILFAAAALVVFILSVYIRHDVLNNRPFDPSSAAAMSEITEYFEHTEEAETLPISANPEPTLSVPTCMTRIEDTWFIVDCYHDRIIYSDSPDKELTAWNVLTEDVSKPHTIAGDGKVLLVDDTDNNRVLVFEKCGDGFAHTQTFNEIGNRPHFTSYNEDTDTFYLWSSMSGEMYLFRHPADSTRMYLTEVRSIPELASSYIRSFTICGDEIIFVSGISATGAEGPRPQILICRLRDFSVKQRIPVPDSMAGMVQITPIGDYYYVATSTDLLGSQDYATLVRVKSLKDLSDENAVEEVYSRYFIGGGTPYYMFPVDNSYYLTEHRIPGHSIWKFDTDKNGNITNAEGIY